MMGFLKRLFGGTPKPKAAAVSPKMSDRLNVFAGTFASEMAATDYALGLTDMRDLSDDLGAPVGVDDVEIIFGVDRISAARPHLHFVGPRRGSNESNTYLLVSDRGYDTATLQDERIVFLGQCTVS